MKLNLPQVIRDAANEWLEQYDGYYDAAWEDLMLRIGLNSWGFMDSIYTVSCGTCSTIFLWMCV